MGLGKLDWVDLRAAGSRSCPRRYVTHLEAAQIWAGQRGAELEYSLFEAGASSPDARLGSTRRLVGGFP